MRRAGITSEQDREVGVSLTVLHFGAQLALLGVLEQRLVALDLVARLAARLVEQSAVAARCRAADKEEETGDESH